MTWRVVAGTQLWTQLGRHRNPRPDCSLVNVMNQGRNEHTPDALKRVRHTQTWRAAAGNMAAETTRKNQSWNMAVRRMRHRVASARDPCRVVVSCFTSTACLEDQATSTTESSRHRRNRLNLSTNMKGQQEEECRGRSRRSGEAGENRQLQIEQVVGEVTKTALEDYVCPDSVRGICLVKRVKNPAVLGQHRGVRQGDAAGVSPNSSSVKVGRASRKVLWRCGHGPQQARPQRRKAEGGRLKEYTKISLTGRKLSERVNQTLWRRVCGAGHGPDEDRPPME